MTIFTNIFGAHQEPPKLKDAREILDMIHAHQCDLATGTPYSTHPVGALRIFETLCPEAGEEEQIAVLFHDAFEDGQYDCEETENRVKLERSHLEALDYSKYTLDLVEAVTKKKTPKSKNRTPDHVIADSHQFTQDLIEKARNGASPYERRVAHMACFIKLADNLHQEERRFHDTTLSPERVQYFEEKYGESIQKLYEFLKEDLQKQHGWTSLEDLKYAVIGSEMHASSPDGADFDPAP